MSDSEDPMHHIGEAVRELRQLRRISVRTLAQRINRSPAFVSQLERNISKPSLKDIYATAAVLDVPIAYFLQDVPTGPEEEKSHILRRDNRRRMEVNGIVTEILSPKIGEGVDFNQTTFLPLAQTETKKYNRPGFETGILLSGKLEMHFSDKIFFLKEGDSYSFKIDEFHHSKNPSSDQTAILVWTVTYL
ncbi:MAG: XRE family transcriptional regulator [Cohaesibacter sp.]|nr:XRE family transcriptional regulator [Cohaesibacter sp.]